MIRSEVHSWSWEARLARGWPWHHRRSSEVPRAVGSSQTGSNPRLASSFALTFRRQLTVLENRRQTVTGNSRSALGHPRTAAVQRIASARSGHSVPPR